MTMAATGVLLVITFFVSISLSERAFVKESKQHFEGSHNLVNAKPYNGSTEKKEGEGVRKVHIVFMNHLGKSIMLHIQF